MKLMNIPIPAETPDPMIDDPALPVPKPEQEPPPTMPPTSEPPKGDPPAAEPPAILERYLPESTFFKEYTHASGIR